MQATSMPDTNLKDRVRILAIFLIVLDLAAVVGSLLIFPVEFVDLRFWSLVLTGVGLLTSIALYLLAPSRYARISVYVALLLLLLLLGAIDPLSGKLGGGTWVLFQICPPIAALVLREPRSTLILSGLTAAVLLTSAVLQLSGVLPVQFLAEQVSLIFNLSMQVSVLLVLSVLIASITVKEKQAQEQTVKAQQESAYQLAQVQDLLVEQQRLNDELAQSFAANRARDEQIAREQAQQESLRRTIATMTAPIVPVLPHVVVLPCIGVFDQSRLAAMSRMLLEEIRAQHIRIIVLDVTALANFDELVAQALIRLSTSCQLIGASMIVVGITPEGAQSLVSIGQKLETLQPMATLQEAIYYAQQRLR